MLSLLPRAWGTLELEHQQYFQSLLAGVFFLVLMSTLNWPWVTFWLHGELDKKLPEDFAGMLIKPIVRCFAMSRCGHHVRVRPGTLPVSTKWRNITDLSGSVDSRNFTQNSFVIHVFTKRLRYEQNVIKWKFLQVGRVFANGPGDLGSIPGQVIPKT